MIRTIVIKITRCHYAQGTWFSHIAVEIPGEYASNEWCEPVSDEEYNKLSE